MDRRHFVSTKVCWGEKTRQRLRCELKIARLLSTMCLYLCFLQNRAPNWTPPPATESRGCWLPCLRYHSRQLVICGVLRKPAPNSSSPQGSSTRGTRTSGPVPGAALKRIKTNNGMLAPTTNPITRLQLTHLGGAGHPSSPLRSPPKACISSRSFVFAGGGLGPNQLSHRRRHVGKLQTSDGRSKRTKVVLRPPLSSPFP